MNSTRIFPLAGITAGLLLASTANAQAPDYSVEFLGVTLNAGAMNDSGQVVGTIATSLPSKAWVAGPGQPLTPLPLPPGRISSLANDVNESGVIVGAVGSGLSPEFGGVAAAWSPNGLGSYDVVELGVLPGHQGSIAIALNDVGDVVGTSSLGTVRHPVLFVAPGLIVDLSATGIFDPRDVNDQRVVVDGSYTAKVLDLTTMVVTDLGVPTGFPQSYLSTSAVAINGASQVCASAILATSTSCYRQAARHTQGVGWEILSGCTANFGAVDMNDLGDVIMQLSVAPYVRFEGVGTFRVEDLIHNTVGHWYVINSYGLAINSLRQVVVPATNQATGQTGLVLLSPETDVGTPLCFGDGSAGACPCGNASTAGGGQGCVHSGGHGAILTASGSTSVASDDLVLHVAGAPGNAVAVFVQGLPAAPVPFKDGLLCAGSPVIRLQQVVLDAGGSASSSVSIVATGNVAPGQVRIYQTWFRDPTGPCAAGSNLSAALSIDWQ